MKDLKIGVALSGGGLCGVGHIGFLKALEENGIKIDMIAGISMGSVIGGLYASGVTISEMESEIIRLTKNDILEINVFKILKEGIFNSKRIEKTLKKYCKVENIEDTKIKFYTQAVDILTGKLYTFEKGPLSEAIRASGSIPGLFSPFFKNDTCYIDGGVVNNVPYNILKEKGADVIIVADCINKYKLKEIPKNLISFLFNGFYILQENLVELQKEKFKDVYDIYCYDNLDGVDPISVDLKKIPEIMENGRICGEKYIKEIKQIIKKKQKK